MRINCVKSKSSGTLGCEMVPWTASSPSPPLKRSSANGSSVFTRATHVHSHIVKWYQSPIWHSYITQQPKVCQINKDRWVGNSKPFLQLLGTSWPEGIERPFIPTDIQCEKEQLYSRGCCTAQLLNKRACLLCVHLSVPSHLHIAGFSWRALLWFLRFHFKEWKSWSAKKNRLFLKIPQSTLTGWSMVCNLTSEQATTTWHKSCPPLLSTHLPLCWQSCWGDCALKQVREHIQLT